MYSQQDLENVIRKIFNNAADNIFSEDEIEDMLREINFSNLHRFMMRCAQTVYEFRCFSDLDVARVYRSLELFNQQASLLCENMQEYLSMGDTNITHSIQFWLLENLNIAVVSSILIKVGEVDDEDVIAEYCVLKGYDWENYAIGDLESYAEELKMLSKDDDDCCPIFYEL